MLLSTFLTAALAVTAAAKRIPAKTIVTNINVITSVSLKLESTTKGVSLINCFITGPKVVSGFITIARQATVDYKEMTDANLAAYSIADQTAICDAFINFVKVHQALLAVVIGKHGFLELIGVAYPLAAGLRAVEGVVDEIAFTILAEVPHCAAKAEREKLALDKTLTKAIEIYAYGLP